jgi:flagellar basal-body rod protein FlgF
MINGMIESTRGCLKEEMRMDVISSNLANTNVVGFKKDRISFQKLLQKVDQNGPVPALVTVKTDMEQGDVRSTENTLDVAIVGKGFFKVLTPEGVLYTRKGNFDLDGEGSLITQDGKTVLGVNGSINIQGKSIEIEADGLIYVDGIQTGQLDVVDFDNYENLVKVGRGLFKNVSGNEIGKAPDTIIRQGALELSNVNVAEEMISMIHSLRAFESYQKSIKAIDELNNQAINQVGRLR